MTDTTDPTKPVAWKYQFPNFNPVYMDEKRDWAETGKWIETPLYDASLLSEYERVKARSEAAEGELSIISVHLDCECDSDAILHVIRETETDLRIYKDRMTSAEADNKRLADERYRLAYAITGGEDAPGLLDSVSVEELERIQRDNVARHNSDIDRLTALEAENKQLREAGSVIPAGYKLVPVEPTEEMIRAMAESKAIDDEGEFPPMCDFLDFSGENKRWTVLKAAYAAMLAASPSPSREETETRDTSALLLEAEGGKGNLPRTHVDGISHRLRDSTQAMASIASVDMELWDRHSNACLEAADHIDQLETALDDLMTWFPDKPSQPFRRQTMITDEMVNRADSILSRSHPGIPDETIRLALAVALSAALSVEQPTPQQLSSSIDWGNPEDPAVKLFVGYDVEGYVEHYELVGNDGEYSPNEQEKTLIEDAIRGVICELHEQLQKILPSTPSPQTHVNGSDDAKAKLELWFFRDMFESNRLALFSLFGFKPADMDTMWKQQKVFRSILAALATEGK